MLVYITAISAAKVLLFLFLQKSKTSELLSNMYDFA